MINIYIGAIGPFDQEVGKQEPGNASKGCLLPGRDRRQNHKGLEKKGPPMKLGRNASCPCGSGKKYKKCCMLKERASAPVLTHHLLRKAADKAPNLLLPYAKKTYGEKSVYEAWDDLWADTAGDFKFDSPFLQVFTPWFMYQWYPEEFDQGDEYQFPSEHTVVAGFLRRNSRQVDSLTKRYLENAQREPLTFWQVEAVEPGKGLLLRDFVTEREFFVHEVSGTRVIKKWDIVFGQVVGIDEEYILSATGPYTLPSSRFREHITAFTDRIKRVKGPSIDPTGLLEYDVDFIMCYLRCVEEILNPTLPEIRNTDGEELVFTTSRYAFSPENRMHIIAKLNSMRNVEHRGDDEEETEYAWAVENKKEPMLEGITKGHITVGPDYIRTECNSQNRDERLKDRLLRYLGELVEYKLTSHKPFDLDELPESQEREEPGALDLGALSDEARQQVAGFVEQMHMKWADEKIPALENKTPREAVKTKEGREKVLGLINDWENSQLRNSNSQFQFDFNKLRMVLGVGVE